MGYLYLFLPVIQASSVVKLLSKRWWIHTVARLEGPRAEVGFPAANQGFSSIEGALFGFYDI